MLAVGLTVLVRLGWFVIKQRDLIPVTRSAAVPVEPIAHR